MMALRRMGTDGSSGLVFSSGYLDSVVIKLGVCSYCAGCAGGWTFAYLGIKKVRSFWQG